MFSRTFDQICVEQATKYEIRIKQKNGNNKEKEKVVHHRNCSYHRMWERFECKVNRNVRDRKRNERNKKERERRKRERDHLSVSIDELLLLYLALNFVSSVFVAVFITTTK